MPTTEIIPLILNYVLGGGLLGFIGYFIHYRSKRRTAAAEATTAEVTAQGGLLGQYEAFIDSLTSENKALKEEIRAERGEAREARKNEAVERERVVQAFKERSDALVEREIIRGQLALAEYNKCDAVRCTRRTPPRTETINENFNEK